MVAIVDYDAGNIRSVENALIALGEEVVITRDPEILLQAEKVILPGVGAFGDAMEKLHAYRLVDVIHQIEEKKTPFLGICLGLQLLFESSDETPGVEGLGILKGKIHRIPDSKDTPVPQIGWNDLCIKEGATLFKGLENKPYVYFVHSYYLKAENREDVAASTNYSVDIDASVERENVYACQFHPEKSSDVGLKILENFIEL